MRLPERIEEINMNPDVVKNRIKKMSREFEEIDKQSQRMKNNLVALESTFKSGNYTRAMEATESVRTKLRSVEKEFDELIRSCDKLIIKIEEITRK